MHKAIAKLLLLLTICMTPAGIQAQAYWDYPSVKAAFTKRHMFWNHIRGGLTPAPFDDPELGDEGWHYRYMELEEVHIEGLPGMRTFLVSGVGGNSLENPQNGVISLQFSSHHAEDIYPPLDSSMYLIGIRNDGTVAYLSGDILLDPLDYFVSGQGDCELRARIRLAHLLPRDIRLLEETDGSVLLEAYSDVLGKPVRIEWSRFPRPGFVIFVPGENSRENVILQQVVTGYEMQEHR